MKCLMVLCLVIQQYSRALVFILCLACVICIYENVWLLSFDCIVIYKVSDGRLSELVGEFYITRGSALTVLPNNHSQYSPGSVTLHSK